jgi:hypothetical protein
MAVAVCTDAVGADAARTGAWRGFREAAVGAPAGKDAGCGWSARDYGWVHGERRGCEIFEVLGPVASSTVMEAWQKQRGEGGREEIRTSGGVAEAAWGGRAWGCGVGREVGDDRLFSFWSFSGKFFTSKPFSISIQKMDPYLGASILRRGYTSLRQYKWRQGIAPKRRCGTYVTWQGSLLALPLPPANSHLALAFVR